MQEPREAVLAAFASVLTRGASALAAERATVSLPAYIDAASQGRFLWAPHHHLIARCFELLAEGRTKRLMLVLPPRHGKSWMASVYGPAWWRGTRPDDYVLVASHTADLAYGFSRQVRNQLLMDEWPWRDVALRHGTAEVKEWHLAPPWHGRYMASSVGGSPSGRGGHLIVIDDAVANREAAYSQNQRDKAWAWYTADIYTRQQPGARILVIGTRWHLDDLQGRLLAHSGQQGYDTWDVLHLPAFALDYTPPWALSPGSVRWQELFTPEDEARFGTRPGCPDPVGREPGQALWPAWLDEVALANFRETLGPRDFAALYQGMPEGGGGDFFKLDMFGQRYRDLADLSLRRVVLSMDSAFKEGVANSYSVVSVWGEVDYIGRRWYALLDVWRNRVAFPALQGAAYALWDKWTTICRGQNIAPLFVIEDKASGQSLLQQLAVPRPGAGGPVLTLPYKPPTGSTKESRADSVMPVFRAGTVLLPESAPWLSDWIAEHLDFPASAFNDQVDTTSMALDVLYNKRQAPGASVQTTVERYGEAERAAQAERGGGSPYHARRGRLGLE